MVTTRLISPLDTCVDFYKLATDPDDTLSFTRAITAGQPIVLGARTYSISNLSWSSSTSNVTMIGVPGRSIIQRNTNSNVGAAFISVSSAVVFIEGIIFDYNSPTVSSNQWSFLCTTSQAAPQSITARQCVFKNMSGSLGAGLAVIGSNPNFNTNVEVTDCEFTNVNWQSLYLASVGSSVVENCYFHDSSGASAVFVTSWLTPTSTNYSSDVLITNCRAERLPSGFAVGGRSAPYSFTSVPPTAINCKMIGNKALDISGYAFGGQGDHIDTIGNMISQSSPAVTVFTAIGYYGRWGRISDNHINYSGTGFNSIDVGGCQYLDVSDNHIVAACSGINIGGTTECRAADNYIAITNSPNLGASAFGVLEVEGDGNGVPFPYFCSGLVIEGNYIVMDGSNSRGIQTVDNPGGRSGAHPTIIQNNKFEVINGASSFYCINAINSGASWLVRGNTVNGVNATFVNPNGNNDIILNDCYDEVSTSSGASTTIRSIISQQMQNYVGQNCLALQSILWVYPNAGGSGYTSQTTLSASGSGGGSGWAGTAKISSGVIVGVHTTAFGTGYSGTITITATDPGGGTGATFIVGNSLTPPLNRTITLNSTSVTSLVQTSGGYLGITNQGPIYLTTGTFLKLRSFGDTQVNNWKLDPTAPIAFFTISGLPAASSTNSGAIVYITNSTTGKWEARSNGTNWLWPDGTTVTT